MQTIYQKAHVAMDEEITRYLSLVEATKGFQNITKSHLKNKDTMLLFAAGIGLSQFSEMGQNADFLVKEFNRKSAVPFDVESAVSVGVYNKIRPYADQLFTNAAKMTKQFTKFEAGKIKEHPYLLPVFQNVMGYSKAKLKTKVGSVSDVNISGPGSVKLAKLLSDSLKNTKVDKGHVLQRMDVTIEGIVRDLVGRILFEEVVAHALDKEGIKYLREEEYSSLSGVLYDFRADFVMPNAEDPIAFIEVRKSSSRHASLYAKDKMFSAINWKGKHKNLIGIIVVEGDWTQATLKIMASVFDYVVPLNKVGELAKILKKAQNGDETLLKWLINFKVSASTNFSSNTLA